MNPIYESIVKSRNGHYCHAIECTYTCELETIVESIIDEYENGCFPDSTTIEDVIDFFTSLSVYYIQDDSLSQSENDTLESEFYAFNFSDYIKGII